MVPIAETNWPSAATWFPILTLVLGAALTALGNYLADRRAVARDREARLEDRRYRARLAQIEFQLSTLVELQEVLSDLGRKIGEMHFVSTKNARKGGRYRDLVGDELSEAHNALHRRMLVLSYRVFDADVRKKLDGFKVAIGEQMFHAVDEASGDSLMSHVIAQHEALMAAVGVALRRLHDQEDLYSRGVDGRSGSAG